LASSDPISLLQALVVQHETLDEEFPQALRGPDAELGAPEAVDPVSNGDHHVQVEVLCLVGLSVRGSCCKIRNN
jgi:hypothetical protein